MAMSPRIAPLPLVCLLLTLCVSSLPVNAGTAYIAIIIDDLGHDFRKGTRAIDIPAQLTYSILPQTVYGSAIATRAHQQGKEVMIHLPMQNRSGKPLEPGALHLAQTPTEFRGTVHDAIARVPHAVGINNHMGSLLTQSDIQMMWLMAEVKRAGLYFVDSRTTAETVAFKTASALHLPVASRDVFLDNERSDAFLSGAYRELIRVAKRQGTAIAIGHPHQETLTFLADVVMQLDPDVEIVPVSTVIRLRHDSMAGLANGAAD